MCDINLHTHTPSYTRHCAARRADTENQSKATSPGDQRGALERRAWRPPFFLPLQVFIFQRFFDNPGLLTTKHVVFASPTLCISELPAYFGRAKAVDPDTGELPELHAPSSSCALASYMPGYI
jgi:hypothetical protein